VLERANEHGKVLEFLNLTELTPENIGRWGGCPLPIYLKIPDLKKK
jgi:hypothetical protein